MHNFVFKVAEHSLFARARVDVRQRAHKDCKIKHGADKVTIYLFYTYSMCVVFLLKITHAVVGFSRLLEYYIRKFEDAKKKKIQEFCRIFAMVVRTQLNAAHAQLNKKLRSDDFLTISTSSERCVFLNNHRIEFHKILQGDPSDSG